jgi:hypothetical protein
MNEQAPPTRDVLAAMLYVVGIILAILAIAPLKEILAAAACVVLAAAYLVALHKFAAMAGALFVLGVRFFLLFVAGKGVLMLVGGLVCAAIVYCVVKLDPMSSAP